MPEAFMQRSTAAQVIVSIIPLVGIVMGAVVVFFYLLWNHRQKMLLIKTGHYVKPEFDFLAFSLFAGLLLLAVGVTLTVFFALMRGRDYVLLGGIIPLACGTGLMVYYGIRRQDRLIMDRMARGCKTRDCAATDDSIS
jgi:predicted benzoate:H+ symporter BenE